MGGGLSRVWSMGVGEGALRLEGSVAIWVRMTLSTK